MDVPHPERLGPYVIEGVLGEGGMGVVYRATQTEPVRRTVALKVLKAGLGSAEVVARFDAERQALAVMDHPCIAKVFDAGVTDDGHSWFAMERVEGTPIHRFCDQERLPVRERVALFKQVCHAVQHAHQKGVIHRDLKPSNILVARVDGVPKPSIIDFGVAKALTPELFDGTDLTLDDQVLGTPAYMSPEQIESPLAVDTRSDVYALGVVLYELLCGALPYPEEAYRGWAAIVSHLQRDPPTLVSRLDTLAHGEAVADRRLRSTAELRRELRGDLEWIVARAMEKDPDRRYETANGLALDLGRYLAFEPVRARGAGTAYRVRRFVRRNRLAVAFAATVTVGLVAFSVVTAVQAQRLARARDVAEARRDQAEGLIDFMLSDLREKLEPVGQLDLLNDVGDQALAYFASVPEEEFSEGELLSRSQALYQIGSVRLSEGRLPAADTAFSESLRLARELSRRDPANQEWLFGRSQAEFWAGELARRRGELDGAMEHFLAYRDISEELGELDPDNPTYLMERGYSHSNVATLHRMEGRLDEALVEFTRALEVKRDVLAADPSLRNRYDLSRSYNTVGVILSDLGRLDEAREMLGADVALKEELLREAPTNALFRTRLGVSLGFLGELAWATGDPEGALARVRRAAALQEERVAEDPTDLVVQRALVVSRWWEARLLAESGRVREAEAILRETAATMEELSRRNPQEAGWRADLATQHQLLAEILLREGRTAEARRHAMEVQDLLEGPSVEGLLDDEDQLDRVQLLLLLGDLEVADGRPRAAEDPWEDAAELSGEALQASGGRDAAALLVEALLRLGRTDEAAPVLDRLRDGGFARPDILRRARAAGLDPG